MFLDADLDGALDLAVANGTLMKPFATSAETLAMRNRRNFF